MDYFCEKPVLLIFFNRPDTFEKVFEKVKEVKPKHLILAQDGPRNDNDKIGIEKCRKIAENIDWECEVIKDYSDKNLGCGVRPMSAITNALERFEDVIVLEDDCVPSLSFFRYCEEMLERYKDDQRISYISGLNHFEEWDCGGNDYFFTKTGAIWGWATWRRAWTPYYDYYVNGISDEYTLKLLKQQFPKKSTFKNKIDAWTKANESFETGEKLSYWDSQWGFVKYSQSMMVIVPKKNLIHNIGIGAGSTHAKILESHTFKKYKTFVFIPTHELEFPLKHPKHVVCDGGYDNLVYRASTKTPIRKFLGRIVKKILNKG